MEVIVKQINAFRLMVATRIDWLMYGSASLLVIFGLITMNSFVGENLYYEKQLIWFLISTVVFFITSIIDWSFLKNTKVIMVIFGLMCTLLLSLFVLARSIKGAQSWLDFGFFAFQPTDLAKLVLILILAKYFSRRHVEIANIRHIIVSGVYAFIVFILIALQPDFGSAMIVFFIWLGMTLVSGISKKHLVAIGTVGVIVFTLMWNFGFQEYQKHRILNFIHPLADIRGTGYNAYQSTIAVGSGQMLGKGIGYGTQSKLKFLPEYQTDFIFAAFAEEWGFIGVIFFCVTFIILVLRIVLNSLRGATNFEILFGLGIATMLMSHFFINTAMNMGLLPVTGITLPFVSYGGSHLLVSFFALGILNSMRRNMRSIHRDLSKNEFVGLIK